MQTIRPSTPHLRSCRPSGSPLPLALVLSSLAGLACPSPPPEPSNTGLTPQTHTKFAIVTGVHAVSCDACHSATETFAKFDCLGCHAHSDPSATNGLHGAVPPVLGVYKYASADCYRCHQADDGLKSAFTHNGVVNGCALCHATGASFAKLPAAASAFDHQTIGSTDCSACHVVSKTAWKPATLPMDLRFDPARTWTVATQTPSWSGTSITALVAGTQALPMPMTHQTTQVPAAAMSACTTCHQMNDGNLYPGFFHDALTAQGLAQPVACLECHAVVPSNAASATSTSMPAGFVGPVGTTPPRDPPSGEMRHDAVVWNKEVQTATPLVTQRCETCHVTPDGASAKPWSVGLGGGAAKVRFHASLTAKGVAQPASCNDCHANNRPAQLTKANAAGLPAGMTYDHTIAPSQADCIACHAGGAGYTSWSDGSYHHVGDTAPASCLPCHSGERPTTAINPTSSWKSTTYTASPFDYLTNAQGIGHGNGNDCVACHTGPGTGAWGTQNWQGGKFTHAATNDAGSTCIACHVAQRPAQVVNYTDANGLPATFDHSLNGLGDCFGCHQATVTTGKYVVNPGDWKGGQTYPGSTPVGAVDQFVSTATFKLLRTSPSNPTLITGVSTATATLYNQLVHTASSIPSAFGLAATADQGKCWHCHVHDAAGKVTSFSGGVYHRSLDAFTPTLGGAVAAIPQPMTQCTQCHAQRPPNIVEKATGTPLMPSPLQPMDHGALFASTVTIGGVQATGAASLDCAACHLKPGGNWTDGFFHKNIAAAVPKDCAACHYQLMADPKSSDMTSGTDFAMVHGSPLITSQACDKCHTGALAKSAQTPIAPTQWSGGAYHPGVATQPTACTDCHTVSAPKSSTTSATVYTMLLGGTSSNRAQWLSHTVAGVAGKECAQCHLADAKTTGSAWSKSDTFHDKVSPATCQGCHGLGNGSSTVATNNNLPLGLVNSPTVSTAGQSAATGVPAGTFDQLSHTDSTVTTHDCNLCHTQSGPSKVAGVQGKEWAQGAFHKNFGNAVPLVIDGTTSRCSNCHLNVKPGPAFTLYDHTSLTAAPGTQDCVACHLAGPDWKGSLVPASAVSDPTRSLTLTSQVPTWSGQSIISVSPLPQTLPMPMLHTSTNVPTTAFSACVNCHSNPSTGYTGGELHASLVSLKAAQPTLCLDCHQASVPVGFVGPVAASPTRSPASAEMRHGAVAWNKDVTTATLLVTQSCGVCHMAPIASTTSPWSAGTAAQPLATYHASLTKASLAQPGSCLDCHANTRPKTLTAPGAALPAGLAYDHTIAPAQSDCIACHFSATAVSTWTGGRYHLAGAAAPGTCLPCHSGERPSAIINATATWKSVTYTASPFDYLTNAQGITHGKGADCVSCHAGPGIGAWGSTQNWQAGVFPHGPATAAGITCIACHLSQRPTAPVPYTNSQGQPATFDHLANGTGDCIGCHTATVTAGKYVAYPADWNGGQGYPGASLVGSPTQFISLTELALLRTNPASPSLITGVSTTQAILYNQFLHTSPAVPAQFGLGASADTTKCWHCHANDGAGHVTSFANGQYHPALDNFTATPGGAKTPLSQATNRCDDCHTVPPYNIVEKLVTAGATSTLSDLQPMDHAALFVSPVVLGGVSASGVPSVDCSACHLAPGVTWTDGLFHKNIAAAVPKDCTQCHYTLMADATASDQTSGLDYTMRHASGQLTFQACQTCHTGALAKGATTPIAPTLWSGGLLHPSLAVAQPTACTECHVVSLPASSTQSSLTYAFALGGSTANAAQWMNHGSNTVTGKDCAACHLTDAKATGSAWSKADSFHTAVPSAVSCQECHGVTNGKGAVIGTGNNLPVGLTDSTTVSTASGGTNGIPAGTLDQISHADVNATAHDCNFCHTQAGASTDVTITGREWAQAKFHASFTGATLPLYNGTTGRCSNCHLNVKPTAAFTTFDHSGFTGTSAQDCASCHQAYPPTRNDWLGAVATPQYLTVGGFLVSQPPALNATTTQGGLTNLPHPPITTCASCHTGGVGAKKAIGYDHASAVINTKTNGCTSCHDSGSNLIGTAWNGNTTNVLSAGAGDTRPITLTVFTAYKGGAGGDSCKITATDTTNFPGALNHFYPIDCFECHRTPTGIALATTGAAYITNSGGGAWLFPHTTGNMTNSRTCNACHTNQTLCPK